MQLAIIQDKMMPLSELPDVYLDRGTFFGDGVYEVLRSYDGTIFALDEHLNRFSNSLAAIHITNVDISGIRQKVLQAFETAGIANAKIYFHITRGSAPRNHACEADLEPTFFLTITEMADDTEENECGIAVSTFPDWRWKRCDIKSLNLLANVLAKQDAERKGCQEAILVDESDLITEGASSGFFIVSGKTVQTAPLAANILPSITRSYVIKAAGNIDLKVLEESATPAQALDADELFIAVTTKGIVPVVKFDGKLITTGRAGKYTKLLIKEFRSFIHACSRQA